ncbi:hypothetical protein GUITHDRAFT_135322 [Guillardia theta CCMP2712]|uniref:Uncharacterized protein n=1 Tax=Guillardia theta (strain CCMP2712) TaxID=905079 RepID=L1JPL3_GUITC|nr:hypothetical protein GUITHDRAFT_135322 [Guillardia theta CCMP2712]EKX50135.1 hypothetical protein GUITHDRAFT_135322 [Guillardia theta CCMP2712]|eukprot:XP_005837115.1 hypothetical protein GUITHDRAFT_135322 [Guillardia theta CCMP2712]
MAGFEYSRLAASMQDELVVKDRQLADAHKKIFHLEARIEQLISREGADGQDGEKRRDFSFQDLMNENDQLRQALEEQKFLIDERISDEEVTHIQFRMAQNRDMARMEEGAKMQIDAASVELKRVKAEMKDWQQFATTTEDRLMRDRSAKLTCDGGMEGMPCAVRGGELLLTCGLKRQASIMQELQILQLKMELNSARDLQEDLLNAADQERSKGERAQELLDAAQKKIANLQARGSVVSQGGDEFPAQLQQLQNELETRDKIIASLEAERMHMLDDLRELPRIQGRCDELLEHLHFLNQHVHTLGEEKEREINHLVTKMKADQVKRLQDALAQESSAREHWQQQAALAESGALNEQLLTTQDELREKETALREIELDLMEAQERVQGLETELREAKREMEMLRGELRQVEIGEGGGGGGEGEWV